MALYHKDIGFPKVTLYSEYALTYSKHATETAERKNITHLPLNIEVSQSNLIELEVINGYPVKAVFRIPHLNGWDLCMAVLLGNGLVKTVWLNHSTDLHYTLDASKYDHP